MSNKYVAVYNITAFSGIGILSINYGIDDYCVNEYFYRGKSTKSTNKIYTTKDGRSYIMKYKVKYYLDEFITINS